MVCSAQESCSRKTVRSLVRGLRFYEENYSSLNKVLVLASSLFYVSFVVVRDCVYFFFIINGKVQISTYL